MIAHTAYFEVLASIEDETSPEWKPTLAGLVVLRLVDDWLDLGAQVVTTDVTGLRAVHNALSDISEGNPVRRILIDLVETLEQAETAIISAISSHLLAYGKALTYAGQWSIAEDVFVTIRNRAEVVVDHEVMIQANLQLGHISRRSGNLDTADGAYLSVIRSAELTSDLESHLRGRYGRVTVIVDRGDLPVADSMLDALISEAQTQGFSELQGRMLNERSALSYLQDDLSASIRFAYQALEYSTDPVTRDRILAQLALSFAQFGHLQASRDANLILASTAQQEEIRWSAYINLMYVAILEGHELAFEQYRSVLERYPLPPRFEAHYRLDVARGFFKFGHPDLAQAALNQAGELAENYAINQLIFEIDRVTDEQSKSTQTVPVTQHWPADIVSIASTIGEWRQLQDVTTAKKIEGAVL